MNTLEDVAILLRNDINWFSMFTLIREVGKSLNDRKNRFHKSDLFEKAIEKFSYGKLQYIDLEGRDFYYQKIESHVEMKFVSYGIHRKTGLMKDKVSEITLLNSRSTNNHSVLPPLYSNFIILVDEHSSALISKQKLQKYIQKNGDGLVAKNVPMFEFEMITTPSDYKDIEPLRLQSYKDKLEEIQETYLNAIMTAMKMKEFKTERRVKSSTLVGFFS